VDQQTPETPQKQVYAQPSLEPREPLIEVTEMMLPITSSGVL
jgi:hypothetical protein